MISDDEFQEALKAGKIHCQWFALCENVATSTEPHPVLVEVPICDRCKEIVRENL